MEPQPSKRQEILAAMLSRLEVIRADSGFNTDAGREVFLNEMPSGGEDDPDEAIVMVVEDDEPRLQGEHVLINLPLDIQAIVKAPATSRALRQAYLAAEGVLQDIKRAVELTDRRLGGLVKWQIDRGTTRTIPREPGSPYVGVAIRYALPYQEQWGRP